MPICKTCEGSSFYDENGKYYCDICGSESLEIQVEVKQELEFGTFMASQHLMLSKKKDRKVTIPDTGKPWVIYEGLQFLLKAQVEALIKMGFSERLKDVVGQLWFSFLCLNEIAFYEDEPSNIPMASVKYTGRHRNVGVIPPSVIRRTFPKKGKVKLAESPKEPHLTENIDDDQANDFFANLEKELEKLKDLDNIKEEIDDQSSDDGGSGGDDEKMSDAESVGSIKLQRDKSGSKVKQKHTLCICYMALVWLEEPVLISDLVRWAREGTLPYHKASQVLPEEMKFSFFDAKILSLKVSLKVKTVFTLSEKLARKLKVDLKFTNEMCKVVVSTVIIDLQLPKNVCMVANHLMYLTSFSVTFNKHTSNHKTLPADGYIAAFILISVKLLYFLDDKQEFKGVTRTKLLEILRLPPLEDSWTEWLTKHQKLYKKKLYNGIPMSLKDLEHIEDLSVYADYCTKDVFNSFQHRDAVRSYHRGINKNEASFDWKARENYHNMFTTVAEEMNNRTDLGGICRVSTSFPVSISHTGEHLNVLQYKHCPQKASADGGNNEKKENEESYVIYTDDDADSSVWHSSYKYFIDVLSQRFEIPTQTIQGCTNVLEKRLFEQDLLETLM